MSYAPEIETAARTLWDYHLVHHSLKKADVIIALGSHDLLVPARAADLWNEGWAPLVVCSGKRGRVTESQERSEAEEFKDVLIASGVKNEAIILEQEATNTGENVRFSKNLLAERGIVPRTVLAIHKPYMERRTLATFLKQWPEVEVVVTSPQISFEEYLGKRSDLIDLLVGDFQRLMLYAKAGFQERQEIPDEVHDAFDLLLYRGYTKHLTLK